MPDPLAPFDDETVRTAAGDIDESRVRSLLRRHQTTIRDLPGVDDLLYEWRQPPYEFPVRFSTEVAHYVLVRDHVWTEFGTAIDATAEELAALERVHAETYRRDRPATLEETGEGERPGPEPTAPMVLVKEA